MPNIYINSFNVNRFNINTRLFSRSYSSTTRSSDKPIPIKVLIKLDNDSIDSYRSLRINKGWGDFLIRPTPSHKDIFLSPYP